MVANDSWGPYASSALLTSLVPHTLNPRPHLLFSHPRTHLGGGDATPRTISPLIEIEDRGKDQTNLEDDPSRVVSGLTSLGHILTSLGQVKLKKMAFSTGIVFLE